MSEREAGAGAFRPLLERIGRAVKGCGGRVRLMEVCGTHTVEIFRTGIRSVLPEGLELISGPGCPVCVTPPSFIDRAVAISKLGGVTVATFGDMIRVPGSRGSLEEARASGADVRAVYSPGDALEAARADAGRKVVFLGVGFETTTPGTAATAIRAVQEGVSNFFMLAAPRLVIPAMEAVVGSEARIDGFICPGHVSVVIGSRPYEAVAKGHGMPCVITGFEAEDILTGIALAAEQAAEGRSEVEIAYRRAVRAEGNPRAMEIMRKVFETADAEWRGLGKIPRSGQVLKGGFAALDAREAFEVEVPEGKEPAGCRCGEVLGGMIAPGECPLFGAACRPESPVGPCMVSSEGSCAAHYRYGGRRGKDGGG